MGKEDLEKNYIAPIIVGILLLLVSGVGINSFLDHQETKTEISYHSDKANQFYDNSQFEEAIKECKHIQEISYDKFPYEYAMAQNNLGNAYQGLSKVRDKETNSQNAINAYQEALKIYTVEKYPINYAMAQNNLGSSYRSLAEVRDKEVNAQNAINAFKEALTIFTVETYPIYYAKTQINLGNVYLDLAEVRDRKTNSQNAINAYQEALKIRTFEKYPIDYATTQGNLGNAQRLLL